MSVLQETTIRHSVVFTLKHAPGSEEEKAFLRDAKILANIPGVLNFEQLKQVSPKASYGFGFVMEFSTPADYAAYNTHPDHVGFVKTRWVPEVETFMELDFEAVQRGATGR
ncbi:Dabb family protein [Devosia rhodophyticola]|uniref:Dabb family protein n=1 Tax=Devosia rhodophyticola TaxID=3026423 RepID=A0ABY7YXP3_9HYPH|nr:Dabb family protein [Devosia rhodophyticola]WDR05785.1 Dabb family protein [Devosia rhodophyticola]